MNNLLLPFIESPAPWTNLNVNSIKAKNFIGSISDVKSGSEGPFSQNTNPKTTSIVFDTPFDTAPNVCASISNSSITNKNSSIYISNKTTTGFDATVFIDNYSSHILETISSDCREYMSLQIVNGNPAVSFNNFDDLFYIRASDAAGSVWGSRTTVFTTDNIGNYNVMRVVNTHPAIAFRNETDDDVEYVRASDVNGDTWATPIKILTAGNVGFNTTMEIVNNHPAVAAFDSPASSIKYIRASDINGTIWASPVNIATGVVNSVMRILTLGGYPALAFSDFNNSSLAIIKASDINGNTWAAPSFVGINGFFKDAAVINNQPAFVYTEGNTMKYIRASDVNGTIWASPITLEGDMIVQNASLNTINGKPAIAYHDNILEDLLYVSALDINGSAWASRIDLDTSDRVGIGCKLIEVQSEFAIAYGQETTNTLKYTKGDGSEGQYNIDYVAQ